MVDLGPHKSYMLRMESSYVQSSGNVQAQATRSENSFFLLVDCPFSAKIWQQIMSWCKIDGPSNNSVGDLLIEVGGSSYRKNIYFVFKLATSWLIWLARNELVFQAKTL